jgi:hypothetical protein
MPEIVADPPDLSCYHLFSGSRIQEFQLLGPDPFSPRAREARRAFRQGEFRQILAAGRAAFPIPSGACPILRPGR